jgi:serine/threonine protein kinase
MDARYVPEFGMDGTLGKYRLMASIGRGGMATIHLALMNGPAGFNKLVVIKQIHAHYAEDPEALAMFLAEARLTARLRHPNLVQANDYWEEGGRHGIAMEFLDGQPLNRILHRLGDRGGLPLALSLRVIADLLGGLHHAHELADYDGRPLGVVHRDVSPHNIFVTYDGVVKVVDFGIAKTADSSVHTGIGVIKGKVAYMAPEQARGGPVDRRADVFAAGVMLWEAVTGDHPWKGLSELTVVRLRAIGQFPSARARKPDLPQALEAILLKALAHDVEDRYATAAELQADIEAYLEATGQHPTSRDLGKLVSTHFAGERAAMDAVIEEHLRRSERPSAAAPQQIPAAERPTLPTTKRCQRPQAPPRSEPSEEKKPCASSAVFSATVVNEIERRPRSRRALVGALALTGAGVMVAAVALSLGGTQRWAEAAPTAVETSAGAPKAPAMVELRISASPPQAQIFLDGVPLVENPFTGRLPRDDAWHSVRIEAPNFVSRTERVTLDRDGVVSVALAGEPSGPPPGTAPSAISAATRSSSAGRSDARRGGN